MFANMKEDERLDFVRRLDLTPAFRRTQNGDPTKQALLKRELPQHYTQHKLADRERVSA